MKFVPRPVKIFWLSAEQSITTIVYSSEILRYVNVKYVFLPLSTKKQLVVHTVSPLHLLPVTVLVNSVCGAGTFWLEPEPV